MLRGVPGAAPDVLRLPASRDQARLARHAPAAPARRAQEDAALPGAAAAAPAAAQARGAGEADRGRTRLLLPAAGASAEVGRLLPRSSPVQVQGFQRADLARHAQQHVRLQDRLLRRGGARLQGRRGLPSEAAGAFSRQHLAGPADLLQGGTAAAPDRPAHPADVRSEWHAVLAPPLPCPLTPQELDAVPRAGERSERQIQERYIPLCSDSLSLTWSCTIGLSTDTSPFS